MSKFHTGTQVGGWNGVGGRGCIREGQDGRWSGHVDHVKTNQLESQPSEQSESSSTGSPEDPLSVPLEDSSVEREDTSGTEAEPTENHSENVTQDSPIQVRIEPRRSTRERRPPDRLGMTEFRPRGEELCVCLCLCEVFIVNGLCMNSVLYCACVLYHSGHI